MYTNIVNPSELMDGKSGMFVDNQVELQLRTLERQTESMKSNMDGFIQAIGYGTNGYDGLLNDAKWFMQEINYTVAGLRSMGSEIYTVSKHGTKLLAGFIAIRKAVQMTASVIAGVQAAKGVASFSGAGSAIIDVLFGLKDARDKGLERVAKSGLLDGANVKPQTAYASNKTPMNSSIVEAGNTAVINQNTAALNKNSIAEINNAQAKRGKASAITSGTAATTAGIFAVTTNTKAINYNSRAEAANSLAGKESAITDAIHTKIIRAETAELARQNAVLGVNNGEQGVRNMLKGTGILSGAAAGLAALGGPISALIGILMTLIPVALLAAEAIGKMGNEQQKVIDQSIEQSAKTMQNLDNVSKIERACISLGKAYNKLADDIKAEGVTEEQKQKIQEEQAEIIEKLKGLSSKAAESFVKDGKIQIEIFKDEAKANREKTAAVIDGEVKQLQQSIRTTEQHLADTKSRIEAMKEEGEAAGALGGIYLWLRQCLADTMEKRADFLEINGQDSIKGTTKYYVGGEEIDNPFFAFDNVTSKQLRDGAAKLRGLDGLEARKKDLDNTLTNLKAQLADKAKQLEDIKKRNEQGEPTDPTVDETNSTKGGSGGNSSTTTSTPVYHDPVLDNIESILKSLNNVVQRQAKAFDEYAKRSGVTTDLRDRRWRVMNDNLTSVKQSIANLRQHSQNLVDDMLVNGVTVEVNAPNIDKTIEKWVARQGEKWMGKFTEDARIQCDSFTAQFYEDAGLKTASGTKFGDNVTSEDDFRWAYYAKGSGYKPERGDYIEWAGHTGIYLGGNQYLARNREGGIHTGTMDEAQEWFGDVEGYGSIRKLSAMSMVPVDIKSKLQEYYGENFQLEALTAEELLKSLESIKKNKSYKETTNKSGTKYSESSAQLSVEESQAIDQTISLIKTMTTSIDNAIKQQTELQNAMHDKYISDTESILNDQKKSVERTYKELSLSRKGLTKEKEAIMAFNKLNTEIELTQKALTELAAKGINGTKELERFTDALRESKMNMITQYNNIMSSHFDDRLRTVEHNSKMTTIKGDFMKKRTATAQLESDKERLAILQAKKFTMWNSMTQEEQFDLDEKLKEQQRKVQDGINAYHKKIMEGFAGVADELIFQGKNLKDILSNLWTDLGRDTLKLLFQQDLTNPSFLTSVLGFGKANNNPDSKLAQELNNIGGIMSSMTPSMLTQITQLQRQVYFNTEAVNANTTALGGQAPSFLSALFGGGSSGGTSGQATGINLAGHGLDMKSATGGRLDGVGSKKFATGGDLGAGKITGAGTGRSDSILSYLANKDKFVWLSNGEYVINEKSAKALGYDTLDALNGYSTGGALETSVTNPTPYVPTINPQVAQRATTIHGSNKVTEALLREQNKQMAEQNSMLRSMGESGNGQMVVLNTQASSADILRALQDNPRAVQAIMGRQSRMGFR